MAILIEYFDKICGNIFYGNGIATCENEIEYLKICKYVNKNKRIFKIFKIKNYYLCGYVYITCLNDNNKEFEFHTYYSMELMKEV